MATHIDDCVHHASTSRWGNCESRTGSWNQPQNDYVSAAMAELGDDVPWCVVWQRGWELQNKDRLA